MNHLIKAFLLLFIAVIIPGCSSEDGDEIVYTKIGFRDVKAENRGKKGYFINADSDGCTFNFYAKDMTSDFAKVSYVKAGDFIEPFFIVYVQDPTEMDWGWGKIESIESEKIEYRITINANPTSEERTVLFEIGNYPFFNHITVKQK